MTFENANPRAQAPFRYDIVGSFLRPEALKTARRQFEAGEIDRAALTKAEDAAIADVVQKQKAAGIKAVSDGEFPRKWWHFDFLFGLDGVEEKPIETYSTNFNAAMHRPVTAQITGKIGFPADHPFLAQFSRLKDIAAGCPVKFTIPSPSILHLIACVRTQQELPAIYAGNHEALFAGLTQACIAAGKAFYDLGLRNLQLDTSWGEFCSSEKRAQYAEKGVDADAAAKRYVQMLKGIRAALPQDMALTMHICRGNCRSSWFSSNGYEPVAAILFSGCSADGFFLEYDSGRAGDFQPLRFIKNQQVGLGLVTTKTGELEDKNAIIARIQECPEIVDISQLCLSPQCGFASTEEGSTLTDGEQWQKLRFIKDIAEEIWSV